MREFGGTASTSGPNPDRRKELALQITTELETTEHGVLSSNVRQSMFTIQVGTRPERPFFDRRYVPKLSGESSEFAWYQHALSLRRGLTPSPAVTQRQDGRIVRDDRHPVEALG